MDSRDACDEVAPELANGLLQGGILGAGGVLEELQLAEHHQGTSAQHRGSPLVIVLGDVCLDARWRHALNPLKLREADPKALDHSQLDRRCRALGLKNG